ncbi:trypsin alpha-like [Drosophila kikkawai]|uniref:trypsin n=1 Tax=Drosophila kikkawai TaxID=30033 RepID=A0ABM4GRC5_DROKI|nr:trypsin alpha-like isoform X2 [Drosophila kikkawai]
MLIICLLLLAANFLFAGVLPASENHIIGGRRIEIKEAPWQVSLRLDGNHICSGSIYSKRIIITAAHCLNFGNGTEYRIDHLSVGVGSTARSNGTVFKVQAKMSHPKFENGSPPNDIALLRLEKPLMMSDSVQPIPLVKKVPAAGSIATATGWGVAGFHTDMSFIVPEYLQGISLEVLSLEYCENYYEDPVAKSSICAKPGICDGDSGGPLVVDLELAGVVAASSDYCDGPSISSSVFYLKDWILEAVNALDQ